MPNHFDFIAPLYARVGRPPDPQRWISIAHLPANGYLLDAGGGTGRVAQVLSASVKQVVVADLSLRMLQHAKNKDGIVLVCSQTEALPFTDGIFERIIIVDALHHVSDQSKTAHELFRLTQPGGWIVIVEPDVNLWPVKVIALIEKLLLMRSRFLSGEKIASLFPDHNTRKKVSKMGLSLIVEVEKRHPGYER